MKEFFLIKELIISKKLKEVFYFKKVRPRDLTENFGTGSAYLINNFIQIEQMLWNLQIYKMI